MKSLIQRLGASCWLIGLIMIASVWIYGGIQQLGMFAVVFQFFILAVGTGMLLLNCLFLNNWLSRTLEHRFWYPWARVSYAIYLVHPFVLFSLMHWSPFFATPTDLAPHHFLMLYGLTMVCSALVAMVSFLVLERPMIDLGIRLSKKLSAKKTADFPHEKSVFN